MSTVTIPPHLWKGLEVMGQDMAVAPAALVNQAIFAWLRINGYVLPGTIGAVPQGVVAPAIPPVVPMVAPVALAAAAPVVAPREPAHAPEPVAAPVVAPTQPGASLETAARRIEEIEADLAKLTKPRPAWAKVAEDEVEEEHEEEPADAEAPDGEQDEPAEQDEPDEPAESAHGDDDEPTAAEPPGPAAMPPDAPRANGLAEAAGEEEDVHTGESTVPSVPTTRPPPDDEPPAEGTFVLRAAPITLVLEREGEGELLVDRDGFIIGRGPKCDLVIDSPRVSREHVSLTRQGITWLLKDLGSSNGTWLGQDRITERELEDGDVILLGNEAVTFRLRPE
jgi:hypothetical protein